MHFYYFPPPGNNQTRIFAISGLLENSKHAFYIISGRWEAKKYLGGRGWDYFREAGHDDTTTMNSNSNKQCNWGGGWDYFQEAGHDEEGFWTVSEIVKHAFCCYFLPSKHAFFENNNIFPSVKCIFPLPLVFAFASQCIIDLPTTVWLKAFLSCTTRSHCARGQRNLRYALTVFLQQTALNPLEIDAWTIAERECWQSHIRQLAAAGGPHAIAHLRAKQQGRVTLSSFPQSFDTVDGAVKNVRSPFRAFSAICLVRREISLVYLISTASRIKGPAAFHFDEVWLALNTLRAGKTSWSQWNFQRTPDRACKA